MSFVCGVCSENLSSDTYGNLNGSRSSENVAIVATLCGHLFHQNCLARAFVDDENYSEWEGLWAKCPTCETPVEINHFIILYPEKKKADDGIFSQSMKLKQIKETEERLKEIDMTISDMGDLLSRSTKSITKMEDLLNTQSAKVKEEINIINGSKDCTPKTSPAPSLRPSPCPLRGRLGTSLKSTFSGPSFIRKFQTSAHYSKNKYQLKGNIMTVTNEGYKRSQSQDEYKTGVTFGDFSETQFSEINQNENKVQRGPKQQLAQGQGLIFETAHHTSQDGNQEMGTNVLDGFPGASLQPSQPTIINCPHCNGMIALWPCQTK